MQLQPIAALRALNLAELTALAKLAARIEQRANKAVENHKASWPAVGKVVQAAAEYLESAKAKGEIARTTSLASYWKKLTGTDVNNHALACSVAFDTFVKGGLIDEADYDKVSASALETASAISNEVGGELTHTALAQAAHELKDRSKNMQKELQKILDGLKGRKKLTAKQVQDFMVRAFEDGHHLVVTAMSLAEMAHVSDPDKAEGFFTTSHDVVAAIELNKDENGNRRFPDKTLDMWVSKRKHSPVNVIVAKDEDEDEENANQTAAKAA